MMNIVKSEGIFEGEKIGAEKEKLETVKKGTEAGISNEIIRTMTGLSDEQIDEIREQIMKTYP